MLYYEDSYMQTFTTKIKKQALDKEGKRFVVLNETAFYPTGGGQPHDTGTLNGVSVFDVEKIAGEIRHFVEGEVTEENGVVYGNINWERRFDHMQQHAGQHILSAAFEQLYDMETVGFHLGSDTVTIDLDGTELTKEMIVAVEKRANQIILEDYPIETRWVTSTELPHYPLRKQPQVEGDIRLVIIPNYDYNGCGGTHPKSTGEVIGIKLLKWERQRKKVRLEFICGHRLLQQFGEKQEVLLQLTQLLSCPLEKMTVTVERLLDEKKSLELALIEMEEQLLVVEAEKLTDNLVLMNDQKVILNIFHDRTIQSLQKLARMIIAGMEDVLVIFVMENGQQLQIVVARGKDISYNLKEVVKRVFPLIEGKGGGKEDFVQGGGKRTMPAQELLEQILTYTLG